MHLLAPHGRERDAEGDGLDGNGISSSTGGRGEREGVHDVVLMPRGWGARSGGNVRRDAVCAQGGVSAASDPNVCQLDDADIIWRTPGGGVHHAVEMQVQVCTEMGLWSTILTSRVVRAAGGLGDVPRSLLLTSAAMRRDQAQRLKMCRDGTQGTNCPFSPPADARAAVQAQARADEDQERAAREADARREEEDEITRYCHSPGAAHVQVNTDAAHGSCEAPRLRGIIPPKSRVALASATALLSGRVGRKNTVLMRLVSGYASAPCRDWVGLVPFPPSVQLMRSCTQYKIYRGEILWARPLAPKPSSRPQLFGRGRCHRKKSIKKLSPPAREDQLTLSARGGNAGTSTLICARREISSLPCLLLTTIPPAAKKLRKLSTWREVLAESACRVARVRARQAWTSRMSTLSVMAC
ncbi:hypothetical protein DFH09DRAFT_1110380 [Mycena vulgaris]|nr:hypothetical protein DFH09DRAFT_1110380 [Mycena vulgaris]